MYFPKRADGKVVSPEIVEGITRLYDDGLYVRAYARLCEVAPLEQWRGAPGLVIAGRLAMNLGGQRLGRFLHAMAWASDRGDAEAAFFHGFNIVGHAGPFAALRFLERLPKFNPRGETSMGDLLALRGHVMADFRDFENADRCMAEAETLGAHPTWLLVERAYVLEKQDALEDALALVDEALKARPWYRTGIQVKANYLQLLGRDGLLATGGTGV